MAAAAIAVAGLKAISTYEESQSEIGQAKQSRTLGYLTADANETRVRADSAQKLGLQRAAAAQSGFDSNTGSLADVQVQSAGNAELDALTQRYQGQLTAWRSAQEIKNAQAQTRGAVAGVALTSALTLAPGLKLGGLGGGTPYAGPDSVMGNTFATLRASNINYG